MSSETPSQPIDMESSSSNMIYSDLSIRNVIKKKADISEKKIGVKIVGCEDPHTIYIQVPMQRSGVIK